MMTNSELIALGALVVAALAALIAANENRLRRKADKARDKAEGDLRRTQLEPEITIEVGGSGSGGNVAMIRVRSTGGPLALVKDVTAVAVSLANGQEIPAGVNVDVLPPGESTAFQITCPVPSPDAWAQMTPAQRSVAPQPLDAFAFRAEYTRRDGQRLRRERQGMAGSVTGPFKI